MEESEKNIAEALASDVCSMCAFSVVFFKALLLVSEYQEVLSSLLIRLDPPVGHAFKNHADYTRYGPVRSLNPFNWSKVDDLAKGSKSTGNLCVAPPLNMLCFRSCITPTSSENVATRTKDEVIDHVLEKLNGWKQVNLLIFVVVHHRRRIPQAES